MSAKTMVAYAFAALAGVAAASGLADGQFGIGTYCIAPYAQTERHILDLKECGIDFVIGLRGDKARPLLEKYGIQEIVSGYIPHPPGSPTAGTWEQTAKLEMFDVGGARFLADLKNGKYPTVAALSLGDEPNAVDFPHLGKTVARTQKAVKGFPLYLNLFPSYASTTNATARYPHAQLGAPTYREYVEAFCRHVPVDHISWDFYMYSPANKQHLPRFYENFVSVADACRRTGRKLRFVAQANSSRSNFWVSVNMLRYQGSATMAFGGESIAWACWTKGWWTNQVVDMNGERTQQYDKLKKVNLELKTIAPEYMRFKNTATWFVGFPADSPELKYVDDRPIAAFDDGFVRGLSAEDGGRLLVGAMSPRTQGCRDRAYFVFAADDPFDESPRTRTVKFKLADGFKASVLGGNGNMPLGMDAEGNRSFKLDSSAGALVVISIE